MKSTYGGMSLLVNLQAYIAHGNIIQDGMLTLSIVTIFWSLAEPIGVIKVGLSPSIKIMLFASFRVLQKWWKMLFISP